MKAPIQNAKNIPINEKAGMIPQMTGALDNYYQPMNFILVAKGISAGFLVESGSAGDAWKSPDGNIIQGKLYCFRGVMIPKSRTLEMKDIGQRKWRGWDLFAQPQLELQDDDCVIFHNVQYRVMASFNQRLYGYMQYFLTEDYKFSGPLIDVISGKTLDGDSIPVKSEDKGVYL